MHYKKRHLIEALRSDVVILQEVDKKDVSAAEQPLTAWTDSNLKKGFGVIGLANARHKVSKRADPNFALASALFNRRLLYHRPLGASVESRAKICARDPRDSRRPRWISRRWQGVAIGGLQQQHGLGQAQEPQHTGQKNSPGLGSAASTIATRRTTKGRSRRKPAFTPGTSASDITSTMHS